MGKGGLGLGWGGVGREKNNGMKRDILQRDVRRAEETGPCYIFFYVHLM